MITKSGNHHIGIAIRINGKAHNVIPPKCSNYIVSAGQLAGNCATGIQIYLTGLQVYFVQIVERIHYIHHSIARIISHFCRIKEEIIILRYILVLHRRLSPLQGIQIHGKEPPIHGITIYRIVNQLCAQDIHPCICGRIRHHTKLLWLPRVHIGKGVPMRHRPKGRVAIDYAGKQSVHKSVNLYRHLIPSDRNLAGVCKTAVLGGNCDDSFALSHTGHQAIFIHCGNTLVRGGKSHFPVEGHVRQHVPGELHPSISGHRGCLLDFHTGDRLGRTNIDII